MKVLCSNWKSSPQQVCFDLVSWGKCFTVLPINNEVTPDPNLSNTSWGKCFTATIDMPTNSEVTPDPNLSNTSWGKCFTATIHMPTNSEVTPDPNLSKKLTTTGLLWCSSTLPEESSLKQLLKHPTNCEVTPDLKLSKKLTTAGLLSWIYNDEGGATTDTNKTELSKKLTTTGLLSWIYDDKGGSSGLYMVFMCHTLIEGDFMHHGDTLSFSQINPGFLRVCRISLLKTLWKKEKLLIMSNFSFSHSVFYPFRELSDIFIKFEILACELFQFGRV